MSRSKLSIKLSDYPFIKEYIKNWIKNYPEKCSFPDMTMLAVSLDCPLIVIYYFFGEHLGFSEELNRKIENLKRFYGITEVF